MHAQFLFLIVGGCSSCVKTCVPVGKVQCIHGLRWPMELFDEENGLSFCSRECLILRSFSFAFGFFSKNLPIFHF